MSVWYDNFKNGNVELGNAWSVQAGGFHILRDPSNRMGKDINWIRGDNVASAFGAKHISHVLPPPAQDLSIPIEWRYIVKYYTVPGVNSDQHLFFPFWSEPTLNYLAVGTGYYLRCRAVTAPAWTIQRWAGGAFQATVLQGNEPTADGEEHFFRVTRDGIGTWRVYLDDALVGGPAVDNVVNTGLYYGLGVDERVGTSEIYIQS